MTADMLKTQQAVKPEYLPVIPENIPDELKAHDQWVVWKALWNKKKWTKPPYNFRTGKMGEWQSPSFWGSFDDVLKTYQAGNWDGIGFVFSKDDLFCGSDFDHCLTDGAVDSHESPLVEIMETYTEISPSGDGLRQFAIGKLPGNSLGHIPYTDNEIKKGVEFYDCNRYLTITGHILKGSNKTFTNDQEAINRLYNTFLTIKERGKTAADDDTVLNEVLKSAIPQQPDHLAGTCRKILEQEGNPCGRFDYSDFPDLLKEYLDQLTEADESDPSLYVQSLLSSLSGMMGRKMILPEGQYHQDLFPNLWCIGIDPSGNLKTTRQKRGSGILYQHEIDIRSEKAALAEDKQALLEDDQIKEKDLKKQLAEIERRAKEVEGNSALLPGRGSIHGLLEAIEFSQGGVVIASEIAQWLKMLGASYNDGAKEILTDLFDCPQYPPKYRTKTGDQLLVVPQHPFLSLNTVTTLRWLTENMTIEDLESGFLARFLVFFPPQNRIRGDARPRQRSNDYSLQNDIYKTAINIRNSQQIRYKFSTESGRMFDQFYDSSFTWLNSQIDQENLEIVNPFFRRWMSYIPKIAMLFEPFLSGTNALSVDAIGAAETVVEYCMKGTVYLLRTELGESDQQRKQRKILEYIALKAGKVRRGDLLVSRRLQGGAGEYDYVLNTLIESGKIGMTADKWGKKADIVYFLEVADYAN